MKGLKFLFDNWLNLFFISLLLFGVYKAVDSMDDATFNNMFYQNKTLPQLSSELLISSAAFNGVTPAFRFQSSIVQGITGERYIVGINDIPYFDATDLVFLAPLLFFCIWLFKGIHLNKNPLADGFLRFIVITLIMIIAFLLVKNFEYNLYLDYTQRLTRLSKENVILARENVLLGMEQTKGFFALISIISGIGILTKLKK